jgi:hypothetical protein
MKRIAPIVLVAVAVSWGAARAQQGVPLGPEFQVNTFTVDDQAFPTLILDPNQVTVVWASDTQDGSGAGVFAQRFSTQGVPQGTEFRVNTFTPGGQYVVAGDTINPAGDFIIVWTSASQDGSAHGVFAQRFSASGATLGGEFRVNTFTTGFQGYPSVSDGGADDFVIVWHSDGQDGSQNGIVGRRFSDTGTALGSEFLVNSYTTGNQVFPTVAGGPGNDFVVIWTSAGQDGSGEGLFGQTFSPAGVPKGSEFRINGHTTGNQFLGDITLMVADPNSPVVVGWGSEFQDGSDTGVFGNIVDPNNPTPGWAGDLSGAPLSPQGGEFQVNTYTTSAQEIPALAADSAGNFVVTWTSLGQDGASYGVFGQRYNAAGVKQGGEFRVNTFTTNLQGVSDVAVDAAGNFIVVWQSMGQDGSLSGIYGQRFGQIVPVELMRFGVE